jgi:hypothetical protein
LTEYLPRPKKPERKTDCECGHAFHEHNYSIVSMFMLEILYILWAGKCNTCMCPHYKQSKIYVDYNDNLSKESNS